MSTARVVFPRDQRKTLGLIEQDSLPVHTPATQRPLSGGGGKGRKIWRAKRLVSVSHEQVRRVPRSSRAYLRVRALPGQLLFRF